MAASETDLYCTAVETGGDAEVAVTVTETVVPEEAAMVAMAVEVPVSIEVMTPFKVMVAAVVAQIAVAVEMAMPVEAEMALSPAAPSFAGGDYQGLLFG